jgi:hypothetical protein
MLDWTAIILGVIEGITEFLPISSTGHLLIAEHWLGQRSDMFNIVIQAGAMLAVTIIYWRRLTALAMDWREPENRAYAAKLTVAFLITAVLGLVAKKLGVVLPETLAPVAWALIIGGFWMIAAEWFAARQGDRPEVSWTVAIVVGVAQVVAGAPATVPPRPSLPSWSAFQPCTRRAFMSFMTSSSTAVDTNSGGRWSPLSSCRPSRLSSRSNGCSVTSSRIDTPHLRSTEFCWVLGSWVSPS